MKNEWIDFKDERPELYKIVEVMRESGEVALGKLDENYDRTAILIQGTGGLFWRPFEDPAKYWRNLNE